MKSEPLASLHLILMSRAPVAGQTKTRLSPPLSPEAARDFHVACLNDLLAEGRAWQRARAARGGAPVHLHLFVTPPASQPAFRGAGVRWPKDYAAHNQRGDTLGARMMHAIRRVQSRARRPAGVLLMGTDLPLLTAAHLDEAAEALPRSDVVFGPTTDGGYYLIAVKEDPMGLFDVSSWGGALVLQQSLLAARMRGKTAALITALPDADTADDLRAILRHPLADPLRERESLRFLQCHFAGG